METFEPAAVAEIAAVNTPEAQQFLLDHLADDPVKLTLSAHKWPLLPIRLLAKQIEARQKLKAKLPSWVANKQVYFAPNLNQEQASSLATASYKTTTWPWYLAIPHTVNQIYDLTLGLGVDAVAWAATKPVMGYEQNTELAAITAHNVKVLGADVTVRPSGFEADLAQFDTIASSLLYLDPDRRTDTNQRLFGLEDCQPNAYEWVPYFLQRGHYVVVKCSPMLDLNTALRTLPTPAEILAISLKGDCRELILAFSPNQVKATNYRAVELAADGTISEFSHAGPTKPGQLASALGAYIYDPGPAINKLHLADTNAVNLGLSKLHPQTYLYTADEYVTGYPGRTFKLLTVTSINGAEIQQVLKQYSPLTGQKAHVAVRNLPMVSEKVAKQLKVAEGGDLQLFVTQISKGLASIDKEKVILVCQRV